MRKSIVLLLLLLSGGVFAQVPASLEADVKKLYWACHDIDITLLSEMLCTTEESVYGKLDGYFLNDDTKFRYVETNAKYHYGAEKIIGGKSYYPITFRNVVRVTYFKPVNVPEKQAELKERFAAQSVTYNKDRNAFMITYPAKMVAISEGGGWKFAFLDNTLPAVSQGCLTETVLKELGL